MRIEEQFVKEYSPRVSVYLDDVKDEDKGEVAGMLRGLMCAIDGWGDKVKCGVWVAFHG